MTSIESSVRSIDVAGTAVAGAAVAGATGTGDCSMESDVCYLDVGDSFDSFLTRFQGNTLVAEYGQVPLKTGAIGNAYPYGTELQDLIMETKDSAVWKHFMETGDQDLTGGSISASIRYIG